MPNLSAAICLSVHALSNDFGKISYGRELAKQAVQQSQAVLPDQRIGIVHDAGQAHNPSPPEALRSFAQALYEHGVAETDLTKSLHDTALRLIER